jgi:hypothetical protein
MERVHPSHPYGAGLAAAFFVISASFMGCSPSDSSAPPASSRGGVAGSPSAFAGSGGSAGVTGNPSTPAAPSSMLPTSSAAGRAAVSGSAGRPAGAGGEMSAADGGGGRAAQAGRDAGGAAGASAAGEGGDSASIALPPLNAGLDYQLGGAYTPADDVKIVSRDRNEQPAKGLYNICYVNGFQAQQSDNDFWNSQHSELVLKDSSGKPVVDKDWNEMLFDVSTADKRTALAAIEAEWIAGCAKSGFDAVEIDNLDSYSRSGARLTEDDAVAFVRLLADAAHMNGLAIAQKNSTELVPRRTEMGTDFAVAEECDRYDECDDYRAGYDDHVLIIEYRKSDFDKGCAAYPQLSIVLRDVDLVSQGQSGYVFDGC